MKLPTTLTGVRFLPFQRPRSHLRVITPEPTKPLIFTSLVDMRIPRVLRAWDADVVAEPPEYRNIAAGLGGMPDDLLLGMLDELQSMRLPVPRSYERDPYLCARIYLDVGRDYPGWLREALDGPAGEHFQAISEHYQLWKCVDAQKSR